jgi:hypothetical protein
MRAAVERAISGTITLSSAPCVTSTGMSSAANAASKSKVRPLIPARTCGGTIMLYAMIVSSSSRDGSCAKQP